MNMPAHAESSVGVTADGTSAISVAPENVCYEAHWRERSVFISAPCQSALEWQWHCLASAILLERLEDACALAETILGDSLQFFVSELPEQCTETSHSLDYMHVVFTRENDEVDIWLPSRAHSKVAQHEKIINASNLQWQSVQARVKVAQFALGADDVSRLSSGSLILIPESWQESWLCSVEIPQFDQRVQATLNPSTQSLSLQNSMPVTEHDLSTASSGAHKDTAATADSSNQNIVQAYLKASVLINPGQVLSTTTAASTDNETLSVPLAQASCNCLLDERPFSAELLPIGDGYGLSVSEY